MFRIGAGEWLVIALVVIILLAMGRLPNVARRAGEAYRSYRQVKQQIDRAKDPTTWINVVATEEKKKNDR